MTTIETINLGGQSPAGIETNNPQSVNWVDPFEHRRQGEMSRHGSAVVGGGGGPLSSVAGSWPSPGLLVTHCSGPVGDSCFCDGSLSVVSRSRSLGDAV